MGRDVGVNWAVQKADFEPDGSLRDIYVLGTTTEDWSKVLEFVRTGSYQAQLTCNESPISFPEDANDLFPKPSEPRAWLLLFQVGGVELACHFFTVDEMEFDFYPNTVGEAELRAILELMADIGDLIGKMVVMTPENCQDIPIFRYEPDRRTMTWIPAT